MPFVQVGVTDRFSIGGGTPLFFGIEEMGTAVLDHAETAGVRKRLRPRSPWECSTPSTRDGDGGGMAYAVSTSGSDAARSRRAGAWPTRNDGGRAGLVMLGGEAAVRRNLKAMTENYSGKTATAWRRPASGFSASGSQPISRSVPDRRGRVHRVPDRQFRLLVLIGVATSRRLRCQDQTGDQELRRKETILLILASCLIF